MKFDLILSFPIRWFIHAVMIVLVFYETGIFTAAALAWLLVTVELTWYTMREMLKNIDGILQIIKEMEKYL